MKRRGALSGLITPFGITQLVMLGIVCVALFLAYRPWQRGRVREAVHEQFPTIIGIDGAQLARWMSAKDEQPPTIFDVRTQAEFDASHLPGALHIAPSATPSSLGYENTPFVVYCTVGFDSASYALGLMQRGYQRVQILDGGIYQWANEGRALEGVLGSKERVKNSSGPYSALLDPAHRAP